MSNKIIATAIALTLGAFAVVGTFAAQDGVNILEDPTETPAATETPVDATATPDPEETPADATETPAPTETPADGTETPAPTDTAEPSETPEATPTPEDGEEEDDGIGGIPQSNPVFTDDDGDGVCEKHEAALKTTPSGKQVRVPCHAVKDSDGEAETADEGDAGHGGKNKGKKKNR